MLLLRNLSQIEAQDDRRQSRRGPTRAVNRV
jgi:hypothetical protein